MLVSKNAEKLERFCGLHELSGVMMDMDDGRQVVWFELDGKTFVAIENPDDGYRSYLDGVYEADHQFSKACKFDPISVFGEYSNGNSEDMLRFLNPETKAPILEIGTEDEDDYYPNFAGYFRPENK